MKIYQFLKYDQQTEIKHIRNYNDERITLCFDFEDGVQNGFDSAKTKLLKEEHRNYFSSIIKKFPRNTKVGVRINATNKVELQNDIYNLKNTNIHSIFLPKIESSTETINIIEKLVDNNISYEELIPIIETKKGLNNLNEITEIREVQHIAFGHCDYNQSLNILPFFHQDSYEYWKWINYIIQNTKDKNICFINSPYLFTNNKSFFNSMIQHLSVICGNNFGQITLTNTQTEQCLIKPTTNTSFTNQLKNRHKTYPTNDYLDSLISEYEEFNTGKGLSKTKDRIISIQEYLCAKRYKSTQNSSVIKLAFVGGCFPVQHDILYEDIFLSKTKQLIEDESDSKLQVDIIRYENFNSVLEKIKKINSKKQFDFLVFSIRPEPFFRLAKLYYKYINNTGTKKYSLNLPVFNWVNPEKYDFLSLGLMYNLNTIPNKSFSHKFLVDLNYFMGKIIGNKSFATKKYIELIRAIETYCLENKIKLVLLGPNNRRKTILEPKFCMVLNRETKSAFPNVSYINGIDTEYNNKELFRENGIHVNELYHELISDRIFTILSENK